MKWSVGTKIGVGFGVLMLIFFSVGAVSYRSTTRLITAAEQRKQTFQLLARLEGLRTALLDVQIGQRGYALTGEEAYLEPYRRAHDGLEGHLQEIRRLTAADDEVQRQLGVLEPQVRAFAVFASQTVEVIRAKGAQAGADHIRNGRGKSYMDDIRRTLSEIERHENARLQQHITASAESADRTQWIIPLGTGVALLLAALAGILLTRDIAGRLGVLTDVAERITVGDLQVSVPTDGRRDEVGVLARAFGRMVQSLRGMAGTAEQIAAGDLRARVTPASPEDTLGNAFASMVENLRDQTRQLVEGAAVLGSSTHQILSSTAQLAASASQSAAAVSETTATVEEVRQTTQVAAQKAQSVSDAAHQAAVIAQEGRKSMEGLVEGMERIRREMDAIAASMLRLGEQSQAIGRIIATVEDLSVQSNLLAVNAAIEAAKAGEQGKGFSVVAQEVRSLAAQSREATTEVRTILNDIQKATTAAVLATEQGGRAVEAGMRQSEIAGGSIQSLSDGVTDAAQAATQIAASSHQQMVGVDQVAAAMESIKQASAQNVAGAKQLEAAARDLNDLGARLRQIVDRYQT